jgi:hypothetical protein
MALPSASTQIRDLMEMDTVRTPPFCPFRQKRFAQSLLLSSLSSPQQIPTLLSHLSSCLSSLLPPESSPTNDNSTDPSSSSGTPAIPPAREEDHDDEESDRFLVSARAYYASLDDIQLHLRSTIHHLKLARVLPTPLDFTSGKTATAGVGTPFASGRVGKEKASPSEGKPGEEGENKLGEDVRDDLGLNALRVEVESWRRVRDSLRELRGMSMAGKGERPKGTMEVDEERGGAGSSRGTED